MPSQARVTVSQSGRYQVLIAAADIGTGARTALLAHLAAAQPRNFRMVSSGRVAATKLDRLAKAQRKPHLAAVAERLSVPRERVVGFSATEKLGVDEVWTALWEAAFPRAW